jgi:hypothetical protein
VASIFHEKYYPEANFLTSNLGRRLSYAWRSIWSSKVLLQAGLIWRVGDGERIKIWKDRWVPLPTTYAIQTPVRILDSEARVSSLINRDTKWWDTQLVHSVFRKEEADLICSIAICPRQYNDRMVWVGTKNGEFSV